MSEGTLCHSSGQFVTSFAAEQREWPVLQKIARFSYETFRIGSAYNEKKFQVSRRNRSPRPTNAEMEILRVLWARGPSTVGQILESPGSARKQGYTTVLKLLQIMHEKGIVTREESFRPHIYRAVRSQAETQRSLLRDLIRKAFGGSAGKLILQALSTQNISDKEVLEIRKLLREASSKKRGR